MRILNLLIIALIVLVSTNSCTKQTIDEATADTEKKLIKHLWTMDEFKTVVYKNDEYQYENVYKKDTNYYQNLYFYSDDLMHFESFKYPAPYYRDTFAYSYFSDTLLMGFNYYIVSSLSENYMELKRSSVNINDQDTFKVEYFEYYSRL